MLPHLHATRPSFCPISEQLRLGYGFDEVVSVHSTVAVRFYLTRIKIKYMLQKYVLDSQFIRQWDLHLHDLTKQ